MKKILIGIAALFLIMAAIPAIIWLPRANFESDSDNGGGKPSSESASSGKKASASGGDMSKNGFLLLCADESQKTLSEKEALSGALAAIIPRDCADEAGYAIAAALYSRLSTLRESRRSGKIKFELCEKGREAPTFLSKDKACENFGNEFYAACEEYADYGLNTRLEYEGKPIDARIFKSCGGVTENALDILGEAIPCHKSVPSPWDMTCDIKSTASYTVDEAKKIISEKFGIKNIPSDPEKYIKIKSRSSGGTVLTAEICGENKTGIEIMNAFSLSSPSFETAVSNKNIIFSVSGSGVPVGMSEK